MVDRFGRTIEYLRLSITDKCNLRCRYCMPKNGVTPVSHDDILRYEEITRLAGIFAQLGIRKIRITGGEPLVRKGVCDLIGRLKSVNGVENVSLTTNGVLLRELAQDLKAAGTDGINISLDTVNEETFRKLTGFDGLPQVMEGLKTAFDRGMRLKINCVPVWGINEGDLCDIALFAKDRPVDVRFIELMPIGEGRGFTGISSNEVLYLLEERFGKSWTLSDRGSGPARMRSFAGFAGRIGFISPISQSFCSSCNRLRLTSTGFLKTCLYYAEGYDLKGALRGGASDEELARLITGAVKEKPAGHRFGEKKDAFEEKRMYQIGG